ncbi:M56 and DUF3738 domain-containing protein [uncultured Paludibaculum sp.]|uniref:M56 and DUF3738 domain-containing protein n=1 Tax=uncultured Paludibaculum sp. TaxID=1765020 RepID=UPI002AAB990E|nr:M56 and DUF3738 domain-containing protein [uncultured Paludibaculum sp.]
MILGELSPAANHLWQSTIFAAAAAAAAFALRRNRPQLRYCVWLAASLKFLVPFSLLVSAGNRIHWTAAPPVSAPVSVAIRQISQPFEPLPFMMAVSAPAPGNMDWDPKIVLWGIWTVGAVAVLAQRWLRWRRIRVALRHASPLPLEGPVPILSSPARLEPGVFGILRPVLLLPEGIGERLAPAQLQSILAHEFCHVRRRDNLTAALHMVVETLFWFHPLVWWIGGQMVKERENCCDEEVLSTGSEPEVYAAGILNVCKHYLESPLACASGVTGSDLMRRVEAIMTHRSSHQLSFTRRLLLTVAGAAAVTGPVLIGVLSAPSSRAQANQGPEGFEVASIKPSDPDARGIRLGLLPGGGIRCENVRLRQLIEFAYEVQPFQISGGPDWLNSRGFDIVAKPPQSAVATDLAQLSLEQQKLLEVQVRQRTRALLAERFQLIVHTASKEMPVYAMVTAKGGVKLKTAGNEEGNKQQMRGRPGQLTGQNMGLDSLANHLSRLLSRPVLDRTGLTGRFNFQLEWTPDGEMEGGPRGPGEAEKAAAVGASAPIGPSLFTALQEQLGLKLESTKGPGAMIVIDRAEKPSEN